MQHMGDYPCGPPQQHQQHPPPMMMRQPSASSTTLGGNPQDYHHHNHNQNQPPHSNYDDSFVTKRMRKIGQRRAVDYTSTVVRYMQGCPKCSYNMKDLAFGCGHQACDECRKDLFTCPECHMQITTKIRLNV